MLQRDLAAAMADIEQLVDERDQLRAQVVEYENMVIFFFNF